MPRIWGGHGPWEDPARPGWAGRGAASPTAQSVWSKWAAGLSPSVKMGILAAPGSRAGVSVRWVLSSRQILCLKGPVALLAHL